MLLLMDTLANGYMSWYLIMYITIGGCTCVLEGYTNHCVDTTVLRSSNSKIIDSTHKCNIQHCCLLTQVLYHNLQAVVHYSSYKHVHGINLCPS